MQYAIKNISTGMLSLNGSLEIIAGFSYTIYDSSTFVVGPNTEDIVSSLSTEAADKTQNLNYCLSNSLAAYCIDGVVKPNSDFYQWFGHFSDNYTYYKQYEGQGLVNVGLDNINGRIMIGTRAILISDLPTGIPATNIANGSVTNDEFVTLNGINTSTTIQSQLDSKQGAQTPRNFVYTQVTPSTLWTINHHLNAAVIPVIYDTHGSELLATINIQDSNNLSAGFSVPTAGTCVVSF